MKRVLSDRDNELLRDFADKIILTCKTEDIDMSIVAAITGQGFITQRAMKKGKDVMLSSMLRTLDVLGYEMLFVKRKDSIKVLENEKYLEAYKQHKEKKRDAKRRERGYLDGQLPVRKPKVKVRVKKRVRKPFDPDYIKSIQSRREELERFKQEQDNIFGTP